MNEIKSSPPVMGQKTHYINGDWTTPAGKTFADYNPLNGELIAEIAAGGRAEAQAAVEAAAAAFPAWAATPPGERQRLFLKAADIADARLKDLARVMAVETGASMAFAAFQVKWSSNLLRQVANWGYMPTGEVLPSDTAGRFAMAIRKPLGVIAGFTPWNGAFNLAIRTIALPLAFGNTVVIKPSELAPMSAGLLPAEIFAEAGFPPGVVNVVAHAPSEAGPIADVFFESPDVRCINFTGSATTARMLASRAGQALKRIVLELGGYNPMLILGDAEIDNAVNATAFGAFFHQGQICMNTRKVYIDRSIHDEFVQKLAVKVGALKHGDPQNPANLIGPLINEKALKQCEDRVEEVRARGAKVVTGGVRDGNIYLPTILTHVPHDATVTTGADETFGPVLVIEAFDDVEAALAKAQATPFGLSAAIMTGDNARGLELAQRFDTGIIHVNGATMAGEPALPNGGVKDSGWGRSGHYAIEDFTEIRLTTLTHGKMQYPF